MPESKTEPKTNDRKIQFVISVKGLALVIIIAMTAIFSSIIMTGYGVLKNKTVHSSERIDQDMIDALNTAFYMGWHSCMNKFDENIGINKVSVATERYLEARLEFADDINDIYGLDVLNASEMNVFSAQDMLTTDTNYY